jgi:hypothetical protein
MFITKVQSIVGEWQIEEVELLVVEVVQLFVESCFHRSRDNQFPDHYM